MAADAPAADAPEPATVAEEAVMAGVVVADPVGPAEQAAVIEAETEETPPADPIEPDVLEVEPVETAPPVSEPQPARAPAPANGYVPGGATKPDDV